MTYIILANFPKSEEAEVTATVAAAGSVSREWVQEMRDDFSLYNAE